jgi:hypothetical protein
MINYQDLNSPYNCIYGISPLPEADMPSIHTQMSIAEHSDTNLNLALRPTKDLEAQRQVPSIHDTTISRYGPPKTSLSPLFSSIEYNNDRSAWATPPPSIRTRKSSKGSIDSHHQKGKRQHKAPHNESEIPPTESSIPRVSSKAVEMITSVENLYEFGVNIGILPEDKETQLSLKRMKRRFVSLLPQPYISESDSSRDEYSDDESNDR